MTPSASDILRACLLLLAAWLMPPAASCQDKPKPPAGQAQQAQQTQKKQAPTKPKTPLARQRILRVTTPDGSKFVLVQDLSQSQIQWATASWVDGDDDPPDLPGLAMATMDASLAGTWRTGSKDATAERAALAKLDEAWQRQMASPRDQKIAAEIVVLDKQARALGDNRTFLRVLAALPADQPQIVKRGQIAVMTLTTIEPALDDVARLLLERREQQALRGLARAWMPNVLERLQQHASQRRNRMHSEVLALLMPFSPQMAKLEPPKPLAPRRAQALATWQASQHPSQVVHVLFGAFDLQATKAILQDVFASTALPEPPQRPTIPLRPLRTQRRSTVPGIANGGFSIAWVLPAAPDPWALETARRWLFGEDGRLMRSLRKRRPGLRIQSQAPWPQSRSGSGLLLLDVEDPGGKPDLLQDVLATCQASVQKQLPNGFYYAANLSIQRDWNRLANDPREAAIWLATHALAWPDDKRVGQAPPISSGESVHQTLKTVLASQPAIVEGKQ